MHGSDETLNDWKVDNDLVLPDEEDWNTLLGSEIMRATFSHTVFTANSDIAFSKKSIEFDHRVGSNGLPGAEIAVINSSQLETLFKIIGTSGSELKVPSFTDIGSISDSINNSGIDIQLLYKFDVTRYTMSKAVLNDPKSGNLSESTDKTLEEEFCKFNSSGNFTGSSKERVVPLNIIEQMVELVS